MEMRSAPSGPQVRSDPVQETPLQQMAQDAIFMWHVAQGSERDMGVATLQERQRVLTSALLGLESTPGSDLDAVRVVRRRLQPEAISSLRQAGVERRVLDRIVPRRTFEHRRHRQELLSLEESERAYRTASILALAEAVFGRREKALSWLGSPKSSLGGEVPMELLDTDIGARLVEEELVAIDEGFFG